MIITIIIRFTWRINFGVSILFCIVFSKHTTAFLFCSIISPSSSSFSLFYHPRLITSFSGTTTSPSFELWSPFVFSFVTLSLSFVFFTLHCFYSCSSKSQVTNGNDILWMNERRQNHSSFFDDNDDVKNFAVKYVCYHRPKYIHICTYVWYIVVGY